METVVRHGAQDRSEKALLEKGQHPYQHTRKQAVSMAAEQMVSNNPTLRKVSLSPAPIYIQIRLHILLLFWVRNGLRSDLSASRGACTQTHLDHAKLVMHAFIL